MTSLVQNQGKRKFILKEGEIAPLGTLEMPDEAAKKICASYPTELVVIKVLSDKLNKSLTTTTSLLKQK